MAAYGNKIALERSSAIANHFARLAHLRLNWNEEGQLEKESENARSVLTELNAESHA